MKHSYLEVTYRNGRPVAGYYYLPREPGDTSARTERLSGGLLADFSPDGRPIGIEITSPAQFNLPALNKALCQLGQPPARPEDVSPLAAA
jgi:hypothetical protein